MASPEANEMKKLKKRLISECQKGNVKEVEECLSKGVDVRNTYCENGEPESMSVFFAACQWPYILNLLLDHPNIVTSEINDAFLWRTRPRFDYQEHRESVSYTDPALIKACRNGWTQSVEKLLEIPDIDVNIQSRDDVSALDVAVRRGDTEIMEMLLKSPGLKEETIRSAFLIGCSTPRMFNYVENLPSDAGRVEVIKQFMRSPTFLETNLNIEGMFRACENNQIDILKFLCEAQGFETLLNHRDPRGGSVIHEVCKNNSFDILRILSQAENFETVLNWTNQEGNTAFESALKNQTRNFKTAKMIAYYQSV